MILLLLIFLDKLSNTDFIWLEELPGISHRLQPFEFLPAFFHPTWQLWTATVWKHGAMWTGEKPAATTGKTSLPTQGLAAHWVPFSTTCEKLPAGDQIFPFLFSARPLCRLVKPRRAGCRLWHFFAWKYYSLQLSSAFTSNPAPTCLLSSFLPDSLVHAPVMRCIQILWKKYGQQMVILIQVHCDTVGSWGDTHPSLEFLILQPLTVNGTTAK